MNQHTPTTCVFEVQRSFLHSQFPRCHKLSKHPSMHHSAGVRTHIDYKILSEWPTMRQRRSPPLPSGIRLETVVGFWRGLQLQYKNLDVKKESYFSYWLAEDGGNMLLHSVWFHCRFVPWSRALSVLLHVLFSTLQAEVLLFRLLEVTHEMFASFTFLNCELRAGHSANPLFNSCWEPRKVKKFS